MPDKEKRQDGHGWNAFDLDHSSARAGPTWAKQQHKDKLH